MPIYKDIKSQFESDGLADQAEKEADSFGRTTGGKLARGSDIRPILSGLGLNEEQSRHAADASNRGYEAGYKNTPIHDLDGPISGDDMARGKEQRRFDKKYEEGAFEPNYSESAKVTKFGHGVIKAGKLVKGGDSELKGRLK